MDARTPYCYFWYNRYFFVISEHVLRILKRRVIRLPEFQHSIFGRTYQAGNCLFLLLFSKSNPCLPPKFVQNKYFHYCFVRRLTATNCLMLWNCTAGHSYIKRLDLFLKHGKRNCLYRNRFLWNVKNGLLPVKLISLKSRVILFSIPDGNCLLPKI